MKKRRLEETNLPSRTDWARIDAMTDDDIDYSDNPEVPEEMFDKMTWFDPKTAFAEFSQEEFVSLDIKKEIVDFFKKHSKKYQTKINEVLLAVVHDYERLHGH